MVNYHTSTLLESSEHVFELIRYIFFGGAPPYQCVAYLLNHDSSALCGALSAPIANIGGRAYELAVGAAGAMRR